VDFGIKKTEHKQNFHIISKTDKNNKRIIVSLQHHFKFNQQKSV